MLVGNDKPLEVSLASRVSHRQGDRLAGRSLALRPTAIVSNNMICAEYMLKNDLRRLKSWAVSR